MVGTIARMYKILNKGKIVSPVVDHAGGALSKWIV
jgi:hypothetical protein